MKKVLFTTTFVLLAFIAGAQSYTRLSYPISWGAGATNDFISNTSWVGLHIEFGHAIHKNSHFGFESGWVTLYDKLPDYIETLDEANTTIRGTQYRYFNVIPILAKYTYRFETSESVRPFAAGGAGISYAERRKDVGIISIIDDEWPVMLAPEVGLTYDMGGSTLFTLSAYYNYMFARGDLDSHSYWGVRVGFAWE